DALPIFTVPTGMSAMRDCLVRQLFQCTQNKYLSINQRQLRNRVRKQSRLSAVQRRLLGIDGRIVDGHFDCGAIVASNLRRTVALAPVPSSILGPWSARR